MAATLVLDETLIREAQRVGHHRSKKAAVTQALIDYVNRHKQLEIVGLFGTIEFRENYDAKKLRG